MSTANEKSSNEFEMVIKQSAEKAKRTTDKFTSFFKEKIYYLSRVNNQTLRTGYKPDSNATFEFRIRFDDHRYGDYLTLTLFQFVSLLRDLRKYFYTEKEIKLREELIAILKFSLKDIDVPKVTIEVDATYSIPNLFELNLICSKGERPITIVLNRKTVQRLIDYEDEIINTIECLQDGTSSYLFHSFITKCVEFLKSEKIDIDKKNLFNTLKEMYKTSFQSEVFLKYWSLIYNHIVEQLHQIASENALEI